MGKKCLRQRPLSSSSHCLPPAPGEPGGPRDPVLPPFAGCPWPLRSLTPAGTCRLRFGGAVRDPSVPTDPGDGASWVQGQGFVLSQDRSSTGQGMWVPGWWCHSPAHPELHFWGCRACVGGSTLPAQPAPRSPSPLPAALPLPARYLALQSHVLLLPRSLLCPHQSHHQSRPAGWPDSVQGMCGFGCSRSKHFSCSLLTVQVLQG